MRTLIILLCIGLQMAQGQETVSLFDCEKLARQNYPYAGDKERIESSTDLKIKSINSAWLPQMNANAQATYQSDAIDLTLPPPINKHIATDKDQYKIYTDINQVIYDGGSIAAQREITKSSSQADLAQHEADMRKILDQVDNIYFSLLLLKENISLMESANATLIQKQSFIQSAIKNGILQQNDLDNISVELLKNKQQINEFKLSYGSGIKVLSELIGQQLQDSVSLLLPEIILTDTAGISRPELKQLDYQKMSLENSLQLTGTQRLPKVSAFIQGGYGKPGLNMLSNSFETYYLLGVSAKWNIWDWGKASKDKQVLSIQEDMIGSRKQAVEKNFNIVIQNSLSRIEQLKSAIETDKSIVELRSSITHRSTSKLELGVITSTDYITDLNAELQAKISLKAHKVQLEQEKVNYLSLKGL